MVASEVEPPWQGAGRRNLAPRVQNFTAQAKTPGLSLAALTKPTTSSDAHTPERKRDTLMCAQVVSMQAMLAKINSSNLLRKR